MRVRDIAGAVWGDGEGGEMGKVRTGHTGSCIDHGRESRFHCMMDTREYRAERDML